MTTTESTTEPTCGITTGRPMPKTDRAAVTGILHHINASGLTPDGASAIVVATKAGIVATSAYPVSATDWMFLLHQLPYRTHFTTRSNRDGRMTATINRLDAE
jgi:hypothetical protein